MLNLRWIAPILLVLAFSAQAAATGAGPLTDYLLITGNKAEDTVSIIRLDTGEELARLETGPQPHEVAISPDGQHAAVVAYGGSTIDIFDVAAEKLAMRVDISPNKRPHGIVWLPDNRIVATSEGSDTLTIIDMNDSASVSAIATGQQGSHMVAVSPTLERAYVTNMRSGTVTVIDLDAGKKLRDLEAGTTPEGLALSPDGSLLWVADRDNAELHVFDTRILERIHSIAVGRFPIRVAVSPDGATVVTSNLADGSLSLVDSATRKLVRSIPVSGSRDAMQVTIVFSSDGSTLYAAETASAAIAAIDMPSGEVIRRYPAGKGSDGLAVTKLARPAQ